jgi:hypothetical protein
LHRLLREPVGPGELGGGAAGERAVLLARIDLNLDLCRRRDLDEALHRAPPHALVAGRLERGRGA